MMDKLVQDFPNQLVQALEIGRNAQISVGTDEVHHVFVAGMGGSGIGANFVAAFIKEECQVPYLVGKAYQVPSYIGKNTLAIASSYSGNTEETLIAFDEILARGARGIVVASGGKLIDKAKELGLDYIQLPSGSPSPRACLGYSLVQQLFILNKTGLISDRAIKEVEKSIALLEREQEDIKQRAEQIAGFLKDKLPIIYTTTRMEPVAVRFRQQVNENAKMLCWHHIIPEMNHNELVGWRQENNNLAVVYFRNRDDYARNGLRIDINKEIITNYSSSIIELYSKGDSLIERSLYFVHLGDWISVYLAEQRGVDAIEIKVIDYLKSELAKVGAKS